MVIPRGDSTSLPANGASSGAPAPRRLAPESSAAPLVVKYVAISALRRAEYNPRQISVEQMRALEQSIKRFGFVDPVIARRSDGLLIGGHQRVEAAQRIGLPEVPVVEVDLSDDECRALNVALNRIGGEWDTVKLADLLASLPKDLAALTGFDEDAMRKVARDADAAIRALQSDLEGDEIPGAPANPVATLGDVWLLGDHRLMCGDSTKPAEVARLMNGERAKLLASDPPYLIDYSGGNHPQSWSNRPEVRDKHWDDYKDPESGVAFFEGYLRAALAHCVEGVPVYQWHAHRRQDLVDEAWKRVGLLRHQQIIWRKAHAVLTRSHYMWQHEPAVYGWLEGTPPALRPPPNETTVWDIDQKDGALVDHPTVKPVEIFARPIRFHTVPGDVCLEPFAGSGTQIVAAEQLGRRCFAMEIAPAYVDVAVQRWEKLAGKKAERVP